MANDFYRTLGVERGATADDIRKAYRKLARKFHPDVNPGNPEAEKKFKDISEAYQILSDEKKRAQYDQFGHAGPGAGPGPGGGGYGHAEQGFDFSDMFGGGQQGGFGDLFESLFSGGGRRQRRSNAPERGQDIYATMRLTFDDAFRGVQREVSLDSADACSICGGTGADPASQPEVCSQCGGRGSIEVNRNFLKLNQICPACGGEGRKSGRICVPCGGQGSKASRKRISVKIPPGVDNGSKIRLSGKGTPGKRGGHTGDLYIITEVEPHTLFERKGNNLYCDMPITIVEAAIGTSIEVPTPEGKASIRIPAGTDSEKSFRMRGKGFPSLQTGARGDLYVRVRITAPRNLGAHDKKILEDFARAHPEDPRANIR